MSELPKPVEEFLESRYSFPTMSSVANYTAEQLLTHPDSPVKKLIEAANGLVLDVGDAVESEVELSREKLKQALAALGVSDD